MTREILKAGAALIGPMLFREADPGGGQAVDDTVLYRDLVLDRAAIDEEARTIPASLSSETEIKRFFGREQLVHTKAAVNLERAASGLPLLFGHNQDEPIGLVKDVRIDGDRLRGTLHFSKNSKATEIWGDVRDGFLENISIGYRIEKWEENDDDDLIRATRWTPMEASVVSVPADHTVGIGRNAAVEAAALAAGRGQAVPLATRDGDGDDPVNVVAFKAAHADGVREGELKAERALLKRQAEVTELFGPFLRRGQTFVALRDELLRKGTKVEAARTSLYALLADDAPEPVAGDLVQAEGSANGPGEQVRTVETPQGRRIDQIRGGADANEQFVHGATQVLLIRSGLITDPALLAEARKSELFGSSCVDLARQYLSLRGVSVRGMNRSAIIGAALTTRGLMFSHTGSDFASLVEDVANKSLGIGYNEAPETWQQWVRIVSIPDFKQANFPNMSAFGDLDIVIAAGEYKYGSFSDKKETMTLATYGKLFSIDRHALVNDDLNAFTSIPSGMGRAAARVPGDLAYNILINGVTATMNEDSIELFDAATHANYVAPGSGGAPSVITIDAGRTAMAIQTDPSGSAVLNLSPGFLLAPKALEGTAKQIQMAEKDPAVASGEAPNFLRDTFVTVTDARLDAYDPLAWFLAANPNQVDTVGIGFLDGQQSPFLETQNGWSVDGVAFKVRLDAAGAALDWRGLYKNDGN